MFRINSKNKPEGNESVVNSLEAVLKVPVYTCVVTCGNNVLYLNKFPLVTTTILVDVAAILVFITDTIRSSNVWLGVMAVYVIIIILIDGIEDANITINNPFLIELEYEEVENNLLEVDDFFDIVMKQNTL